MKNKMMPLLTVIMLAIVSALLIMLTFQYAIDLSSFAVGLAKYTLAVIVVMIVDSLVVYEINTLEMLKQSPVAYAIFLFGNLFLAGVCIALS